MPVDTKMRPLTRHCVLCRLDKPAALCMDVNSGRGAMVWVCRRCWYRHVSQAEQMGLNNRYFLLREKLTRLGPYETHSRSGTVPCETTL